ncbi:MAG: hypothetical protein QOH32_3274, partial [Bradyrhizobium sp.]|nr:hypothetical protein [Bradyrhizobium sp.]
MWKSRLVRACVIALVAGAALGLCREAVAQANFDRPGSDYT